jgi:hypothetical protein
MQLWMVRRAEVLYYIFRAGEIEVPSAADPSDM